MKFDDAARRAARRLIEWSLEEDHAGDDVTSRLAVAENAHGKFAVRNRGEGTVAGLEAIEITLDVFAADARATIGVVDGTHCPEPVVLATVEGRRRDVLAAERTFLNLVGALSGTATLTRRFADAAGPDCTILDTRKTWPGYRALQKYAVRCGGGKNHRPHLAGGILLKDNHRGEDLDLATMVTRARAEHPELELVVEVDSLEQFDRVLALDVDRVLLDNFDADAVRVARTRRDARGVSIGLEVSGGVDLDTVGALARAGAEFASVGALTHSAPVWDVGLDEIDA